MIISIQSQVVLGHVGNSAAVPILQAHGLEVAAVPTTLLSNHPHYPTMRGNVLPPQLLQDLLLGVEERGLVERAAVLLTGYLGSLENGRTIRDFVLRAKQLNPQLLYVCDPVCGDEDLGAFVDRALLPFFADELLPLADLATPNAWEVEALTGYSCGVRGGITAVQAMQALGPSKVVVTGGCSHGCELQILAADGDTAWEVRSPRLEVRPAGTGDVFTACLVARLVLGDQIAEAAEAAVDVTFAILERTAGTPWSEMPLPACLASVAESSGRFSAQPLHLVEGS